MSASQQATPAIVILALFSVLVPGCAPVADCPSAGNCSPTALPEIARPPDVTPTYTPHPTSAASNMYQLTASQLNRLGAPAQPFVYKRTVVLERFASGVMLVFARSDQGFDAGGEYVFALAKDGRAWRIEDTWVEQATN